MDRAPRARRMPLHDSNLLSESMQSTSAQQLVADQQLTFALNSKFSYRKLPRNNSDNAVR